MEHLMVVKILFLKADILICKVPLNVNYFAADEGKSLISKVFVGAETPFLHVCRIYF